MKTGKYSVNIIVSTPFSENKIGTGIVDYTIAGAAYIGWHNEPNVKSIEVYEHKSETEVTKLEDPSSFFNVEPIKQKV